MALPEYRKECMCPKCDDWEIGTQWCAGNKVWDIKFHTAETTKEHFHRSCRNCGYEWLEATRNNREA